VCLLRNAKNKKILEFNFNRKVTFKLQHDIFLPQGCDEQYGRNVNMCRCLHSIFIHRFKNSTKAEVAQLTKYFQHRFKAQKSCNNFIKTFKLQNNVHCCSGVDKNLLILQT